jgi:hypothetical protein
MGRGRFSPRAKKAYRIDHKIRALETITFGTTELLAIYAAHATLAAMAGTPIHEDLKAVMTKIRGFLSPRHNGGLDALSRVLRRTLEITSTMSRSRNSSIRSSIAAFEDQFPLAIVRRYERNDMGEDVVAFDDASINGVRARYLCDLCLRGH